LDGGLEDEDGRGENEARRWVKLMRGFWVGKTECTQGQWESVMDSDVGGLKRTVADEEPFGEVTATGLDVAMYFTSWDDAQEWIKEMNGRHPLPTGWKWSLPTEAEWEYACRAGTKTALSNGPLTIIGNLHGPELDAIAWYGGNSSEGYKGSGYDTSEWDGKQYPGGIAGVREVGLKQGNPWGLHDMHGNVFEWCGDWYGDYEAGTSTDPNEVRSGVLRGFRGGSWGTDAADCRSASRVRHAPGFRSHDIGFRPALVPSIR